MNRFLCFTLPLCLLFGCGTALAQKNTDIIDVEACEKTCQYRERIFLAEDARQMSKETQEAVFRKAMQEKSARTEQPLPTVQVAHTLKTEQKELGKVYTLEGDKYERVVLYIHGGAWVDPLSPEHVTLCDRLAEILSAKVYMPAYPLAPEATYREGYAMVESLYRELLLENKPIYVMGDSAGGTVALGLVLALKEEGVQLPEKVVVFAPCADATFTNPEISEYQKKDGLLPARFCRLCAEKWADGEDLSKPVFSPLNGDFTGFPDTLIYAGTYDLLYPDDIRLFEKMKAAGVHTRLVNGIGFWHVYIASDTAELPRLMELLRSFCLGQDGRQ